MPALLSDLLSKLRTSCDVPQLRLDYMNSLLRVLRTAKEPLDLDPILECLRSCLCDSAKEIRANAFRILRHIVTDASVALAMMSYQIDLFIVRALTRDQRNDLEREQALKLVRAFVDGSGGAGIVPHSIVRTLVAIAEQPDDKFRIVALETVCELAVVNIEVVALCGGLKSIFGALLDGPPEISEMLIITVSYILDQERTRSYVRPSVDLEVLFANFTDAFSKGPSHQERFEASMRVICSLLKTWTGALYLCFDDKKAIISIVEALKLPNEEIRALIDIMQDSNRDLSLRCIILVGELLQLTHRLLPFTHWPKVQPVASLFRNASNFADETMRHAATAALASIDGLLRARDTEDGRNTRKVIEAPKAPPQRPRVDYGDETQFKSMLADMEKMLGSKDFLRWNWDAIQELVEGPLINPRRMEEAIKNSKVVKRLVSFFRPLSHQFSDIKKGKGTSMFVRLGCELFKTLLSSPEGVRYMSESKFLPELAECLGQLDPIYSNALEPIFSKSRIELTLTGEYFAILACFTRHHEGIRLLEKFRIFNILYHLTELRSRDDLIKTFVRALDFSGEGHERIILTKLMTSSYKHIRLFTTEHLGTLVLTGGDDFIAWAVPMLITQIYDPAMEVCEAATAALDKACEEDVRKLEITVGMEPYLDGLGGYSENLNFVIRAELSLTHSSYGPERSPIRSPIESPQSPEILAHVESDIPFPQHFYGDLTKTVGGCAVLESAGHVGFMADLIRKAVGGDEMDEAGILKLKAALWGVGFMGSNPHGLDLICGEDLVEDIVKIAVSSTTFSIRGTCYHALGLIGASPKGAELLFQLNWEVVSALPGNGMVGSVAVPHDLDAFVTVPKWTFRGSWPETWVEEETREKFDSVGEEALKLVGNMGNHILANAASKGLSRLRHEHPAHFANIHLYLEVSRMLSCLHYRMTARRFIQELFDKVPFDDADGETVGIVAGSYRRY
ncbi:hypothetical protein HDU67_006498 [Dinochytrium kinnereticum]|nr:hypothetical protein HDU67_006498 [Dinochytrium kinnereticum]